MMNTIRAGLFALLTLAPACSSTVTGATPCDVDDMCPAGEHCAPGGCMADCREDRDCRALGLEAVCDAAGRCHSMMPCATNADCQNDSLCDGAEECRPTAAGHDARGCVAAAMPLCAAPLHCIEDGNPHCQVCAVSDADGDGFDSVDCGGDDCDDTNRNVNPGAREVCDAANLDEDCMPRTFGNLDLDSDGYPSMTCCNMAPDGTPYCGNDCVDAYVSDNPDAASIHPSAAETCDEMDQDCDGFIDETMDPSGGRIDGGLRIEMWPDNDGDGFGALVSATLICQPIGEAMHWVRNSTDCNDDNPLVFPGAQDGPVANCNGHDDNCDGLTDGIAATGAHCACIDGATQSCGIDTGRCVAGLQTCSGGTFGVCAGEVRPTTEICSGTSRTPNDDENCDGTIDEIGGSIACHTNASQSCLLCPSFSTTLMGTQTCDTACSWGTCTMAPGQVAMLYGINFIPAGVTEITVIPCNTMWEMTGYLDVLSTSASSFGCGYHATGTNLPGGTYRFEFDIDYMGGGTVEFGFQANGTVLGPVLPGDTVAGYPVFGVHTHTRNLTLGACTQNVSPVIVSRRIGTGSTVGGFVVRAVRIIRL